MLDLKTGLRTAACGAALVAALGVARPAQAQSSPGDAAEIAALKAEVAKLSAAINALESREAASAPTSAASAGAPGAPKAEVASGAAEPAGPQAETPTTGAIASVSGGKPTIQSSDGRFTANLHAVMQFDAADYLQRGPGPLATDLRRGGSPADTSHARDLASGTDFRRARLGLDGKVFGDFEYSVLLEFGGAGEEDAGHVQELWIQYSGVGPFHARVGAFAPFIGLEDAGSTNGMLFLERPAISDLARNLGAGDYREGAQLVANTPRWFVSGAVTGRADGVINSTGSAVTQPYGDPLGFVGRVAAIPFQGDDWLVHVGAHGSHVVHPADTGGPDAAASVVRYPVEFRIQPELRADGTRLIDTGAINAKSASTLGLEFAAEKQNLMIQGEWERLGIERLNSTAANPDFSGWYVEGSWILTGESRRYNTGNFAFDGPAVAHNFDPRSGNWGAIELAFRYSEADLNFDIGKPGTAASASAVRGGDQRIASAGANWYLNSVVRFMLQVQDVRIDRLSPNAATFVTPAGAQIGQHYQAVSLRSQFAF